MQTQILLTITHSKPLPKDAEEVIAQRFYMWSFARGVEVGVTAKMHEPPIPLPLDYARCLGHGAGPSGHQNRVDCQHCRRRLASRPSGVTYIAPPAEFPCPQRIGANE